MVRSLVKIVLVLSILLVAVPPIQAAESPAEARSGWSGFFAELWEVVSTVWGGNGCILDPNGSCRDSSQADNGCWVDPNGSCRG
jgi:hypothetical protein